MKFRNWLVLLFLFTSQSIYAAVSSEVSRTDYIGNGAVSAYGFTFPVKSTSELRVFVQDANGQDVELFLGSGYTCALTSSGTGTITLTAGSLANGYKLSIQRGIPYTQTYNPSTSGAYNPASLGVALDRLSHEIIRLKGDVDRAIKIPYLEAGGDTVVKIPDNAANRASGALGFDSDGNITVGVSTVATATVSAWAETLLDDSNAAAARATLGGVSTSVDTVAAMTALTGNDRVGTIIVRGRTTKGDGGGGEFYWDAASTATADGGTIFESDAGGTGRFIRIYSGPLELTWFGADKSGAIDSVVAFTRIFNGFPSGATIHAQAGDYKVASAISLPANVSIEGDGEIVTTFTATGNFTVFTIVGRNAIGKCRIVGASKTGTGVNIGGSDFAGQVVIDRVRINGFATGLRCAGSLWTTVKDTVIDSNLVGVDFNAATSGHYSTTTDFFNCSISLNDRQGVKTGYVPVRNQSIQFIGGSIENNGSENPAVYGQCELTTAEQVGLLGLYVEYSIAGAKPKGVVLNDMSHVTIDRLFCNGSSIGVYSGSNPLYYCKISRSRFIGTTTNDIDITGGANAVGIILEHNEYSATNSLNVAANNLTNITKRYPEWTNEQTSFTPTILGGSTPGTPTYTVQSGVYTVIGNMVFIQGRITISAKGGMVGVIRIGGLPFASANSAHASGVIGVQLDGVTVSGGNTAFSALVAPGTSQCDLYQQGSATSAQIVDTQLAAGTTVIFSGWYSK